MTNKQFVTTSLLALCLVLGTVCCTGQDGRMVASPGHVELPSTEGNIRSHPGTSTPTPSPIPQLVTSTSTPSSAALIPTNTATVTPSSTETPESQLLSYSADVAFPFALGNTWVYSGTIYTGFNPTTIFTATYAVTESVAALQYHPPYTIVHIHREQVPSPIPADDAHWSAEELTAAEDYWYVIEDTTVYRVGEEPHRDTIATSVATGTAEIAFVFPLEIGKRWYLNEKMRKLYPGFETDSMLRQVVEQEAIETSTETFEECFQMTEVIGGYTFETWFCPGVGIVARKADHSGTPMGMHELLMEYKLDGTD